MILNSSADSFISYQNLFSLASKAIRERILSIEKIEVGVMTHKYIIRTYVNEFYIIRFYPNSIKSVINFEPDLLIKARKVGALVPEVIYDSKGAQSEYAYIIYKMLDGFSLSRILNGKYVLSETLIYDIFSNISSLHKIEFEKYGPLKDSSTGYYDSWMDFINEVFDLNINYIKVLYENIDKRNRVLRFIDKCKSELSVKMISPCLIWNDISLDNIIVDEKGLSGFVDFDSAASGDSLMPLGYLYARQGESLFFKKLFKIYRNQAHFSFDIVKLYAIFRVLRISKYQSEPLPNGQIREKLNLVFPGAFQIMNSL